MKNIFQIVIIILVSVITLTRCKKNTDSASAHWNKVNFPNVVTVKFLKINGTTIYAGTYEGIYRSNNNGDSWTDINNGLPSNRNITALTFSGQDIFASINDSNAIFISTNNGSSWTNSNNGIPYIPSIDPDRYNIVGLYAYNSTIFASTRWGGIYRSTDNGSNWTSANNGFNNPPNVGDLYKEPSLTFNGGNIYAGLKGGIIPHFYKSINNGTDWTYAGNGLPELLTIYSVAYNEDNLFIMSDSAKIYKSTNNGDSWLLSNSGINIKDQNTVYQLAFYDSVIFAGANMGLCISTDNGNTWVQEEFQSEFGLPSIGVGSIAITGSTIYISGGNSSNKGVWKRSL